MGCFCLKNGFYRSNTMVEITDSIINPVELAKNNQANLICPKIVIDDPELSPTLKLALIKIFNLCLKEGSYRVLVNDLLIAELVNRKERTARSYITKLTKLTRLYKIPSKQKGHYYLAFLHNEWMKLNSCELLPISALDDELNSLASKDSTPINSITPTTEKEANNLSKPVEQSLNKVLSDQPSQLPSTNIATLAVTNSNQNSSKSKNTQPNNQASQGPAAATSHTHKLGVIDIEKHFDSLVKSGKLSTVSDFKNTENITTNDKANNALTTLSPEQEINQDEQEAEILYSKLSEEQLDLFPSIADSIEKQWQESGKLPQIKQQWVNSKNRSHWDDFLFEQINSEIKLELYIQFKDTLADCEYENEDEAIELAINSLLYQYNLLDSLSQSSNQDFPAPFINTTLANSCQNDQAINFATLNDKESLATPCQNDHNKTVQTQNIKHSSKSFGNALPTLSLISRIENTTNQVEVDATTKLPVKSSTTNTSTASLRTRESRFHNSQFY